MYAITLSSRRPERDIAPLSAPVHVLVLFGLSMLLHIAALRWLNQPRLPTVPPQPPMPVEVVILAPGPEPAVPAAAQAAPPEPEPPAPAMREPAKRDPAPVPAVQRPALRKEPRLQRRPQPTTVPERPPVTQAPASAAPAPVINPTAAAPAPALTSEALVKATHVGGYLHNPKPKYPEIARRRGWEGRVRLRVDVTPEGRCGHVAVEKSSGHDVLDSAALEAVKSWTFIPARRGSLAVADTVIVSIHFDQRDDES